jgi:hypothetical protein
LTKPEKFELNNVIAIGRTFDEYCSMFDLTFTGLKGAQILDAGGGVSSFTAEANELGLQVKSADRIYGLSPEKLYDKGMADLKEVRSKIGDISGHYNWDFYRDENGLRSYREKAITKFIPDFKTYGNRRYINTSFPDTVFTDKEFDITLVSHFIFLYDEHLDYNFHMDTLKELIRITKEEIRIFPLWNLRWKKSDFVDSIMKEADLSKVKIELKKSNLEFVKGANEYMKITL